jgi:hypothetical protein
MPARVGANHRSPSYRPVGGSAPVRIRSVLKEVQSAYSGRRMTVVSGHGSRPTLSSGSRRQANPACGFILGGGRIGQPYCRLACHFGRPAERRGDAEA